MQRRCQDDGWRLPDALWLRMEPLLLASKPHSLGCHRPRLSNRSAMDAIFVLLRTGMQCRALDATGICSSSSAYRRFHEWAQAGVFAAFWTQGLLQREQLHRIDWEWLALDGTMTKAPLGGKKNRSQSYRPRKKRRQAQLADRCKGLAFGHCRGCGQSPRRDAGRRYAFAFGGAPAWATKTAPTAVHGFGLRLKQSAILCPTDDVGALPAPQKARATRQKGPARVYRAHPPLGS